MKTSTTSIRIILVAGLLTGVLAACAGTTSPTAQPAESSPATSVATEQVAVPATSAPAQDAAPTAAPVAATSQAEAAPAVANSKLNLNEASGDDYLQAIPGFSSRMVREFLEYRPYVSILQFRQEIGKYVGEEQVAEWEKYVYVPVAVDSADAATLMQIPGMDGTTAQALMAARPFGSNAAFLAKLAELAPAVDQAVAQGYLAAQ
jgi:DNA uptake protein ComE-like DNA-binding protein